MKRIHHAIIVGALMAAVVCLVPSARAQDGGGAAPAAQAMSGGGATVRAGHLPRRLRMGLHFRLVARGQVRLFDERYQPGIHRATPAQSANSALTSATCNRP